MATAALSAQAGGNRAKTLLEQAELKGLEGYDLRMMEVEQDPGVRGSRHWRHDHPHRLRPVADREAECLLGSGAVSL